MIVGFSLPRLRAGSSLIRMLAPCLLFAVPATLRAGDAVRILFIGNSFTFGGGTAVQTYHPETVTDLNRSRIGGVPALFKAFTLQADLNYAVSLETAPGKGLDYHFKEKAALISKPWDVVCMHGYSTLDKANPGDPAQLVTSAGQVARLLHEQNPAVTLYLTATWARADQIYRSQGAWSGKSVKAMTADLRNGYDKATAACLLIKGVIPVGEAWLHAMENGVADPNPYDGITAGKMDLWGKDHYHASVYGYYLEALTIFAVVTGRDPRTLGEHERAAADLGISPADAKTLQLIAFDQVNPARYRQDQAGRVLEAGVVRPVP